MKSSLVILASSIFISFGWQYNNISLREKTSNHLSFTKADGDSSQSIRITNGSSLRHLPAIIRDLTAALNKSEFQAGSLLNKNGIRVYLYDVTCNSFENAAAVRYQVNDTIFHLKLNRYNKLATDKALAATLIHELMHCVLLDIFNNARRGDEKALATIASFGANGNDSSQDFKNHFFNLINGGDAGQHELIYQLFYPQMVSLLERFAELHHDAFSNQQESGRLMWSGLQEIAAYKKLQADEKRNIELTILEAKGAKVNLEDY